MTDFALPLSDWQQVVVVFVTIPIHTSIHINDTNTTACAVNFKQTTAFYSCSQHDISYRMWSTLVKECMHGVQHIAAHCNNTQCEIYMASATSCVSRVPSTRKEECSTNTRKEECGTKLPTQEKKNVAPKSKHKKRRRMWHRTQEKKKRTWDEMQEHRTKHNRKSE